MKLASGPDQPSLAKRSLPSGITPRLLSRGAAAAYCGISAATFDEHVVQAVKPIAIGRRTLWDIKALDRWLDQRSGLTHAVDNRSMAERLNNGNQGARR